MALAWLLTWAPFKIDALGLVTLLGADEINKRVGRMCVSGITEFLPVVAGHIIADESLYTPLLGTTVYNITDAICATDVVAWFSRWLVCQSLTYNTTIITVGVLPAPGVSTRPLLCKASVLGCCVLSSMIALAVVLHDWWGLANALGLTVAVIARFEMLEQIRNSINVASQRGADQSLTMVKTLWRVADGSHITIYTTRGILTECLLTAPKPRHPLRNIFYRALAWAAFLTHVLSLGMAALPSQILCVTTLGLSTLGVKLNVGSDDEHVGSRIHIQRMNQFHNGHSMAAMFARLSLTKEEEENMVDWGLMPLFRNRVWWEKYRAAVAQNDSRAFQSWKSKTSWEAFEGRPVST